MDANNLVSARELARRNGLSFPNESPEYRQARDELLAEEIELRRHIERVAEQRRALPPGGQVRKDYRFQGADGEVTLRDLFGGKSTLVIYSYMYGPQRERPCPMCTSMLSALDGEVPDICQQVAFAVVARSPIERLLAFKKERGWHHLPLYSDTTDEFSRDYHAIGPDGGDDAAYNVFTVKDGVIHHFCRFDAIEPDECRAQAWIEGRLVFEVESRRVVRHEPEPADHRHDEEVDALREGDCILLPIDASVDQSCRWLGQE